MSSNIYRSHDQNEGIHYASLDFLMRVSCWEEKWDSDYIAFWCRLNWLRAHVYRKRAQTALANTALQLVCKY